MMRYIFQKPVTIGDLDNPLTVDALDVHSISLTLEPQEPVLSIVLLHKASGWKHTVTYRDPSAVEFWARTCETEFDLLHGAVLKKMVADGKLPAGAIVLDAPYSSSSTA